MRELPYRIASYLADALAFTLACLIAAVLVGLHG